MTADTDAYDFVLVEIGGTVGDIESLPFLEAIRQLANELGTTRSLFVHLTLVPYIPSAGELKTKPTQHSVAALRNIGIQPDAIVCRADREIGANLKRKISLMCDVDPDGVIAAVDAPSIYDIPRVLHAEGLDAYVVRKLGLPFRDVNWRQWDDVLTRVHHPRSEVEIALVGKYVDLPDAYLSVVEALRAGGFAHHARVNIRWVLADECETAAGAADALRGVHGVLIPGGFGYRGVPGKLGAITWARQAKVPILGLCLGLQCMVIETARALAELSDANSTEFELDCAHPVVSTMAEQLAVVDGDADMGGTMRLGSYPARLSQGSIVAQAYGTTGVSERHRHRYEVNNVYRDKLSAVGLEISGTSPDGRLVEFVELDRELHPFFVATQGHPEFESRPTRPHPLFAALVEAGLTYAAAERLPVELPAHDVTT